MLRYVMLESMLCVFVAVAARERGPAGVTGGTTAPERTAQAIVTTSAAAAAAASGITAADQLDVCKNTRFCDRACCIFRKRLHLLFPRTTLFMISRVLQSL